jgi:two-component system, LytTR family, sensor kinase
MGRRATIDLQRAGRTRPGDGLLEYRAGDPREGLPKWPSAAHPCPMDTPRESASRALGTPKARWLLLFGLLTFFAILDCVHDYVSYRADGDPVSVWKEVVGGLFYWGPCLALVPVVIALVHRYPLSLSRPRWIVLHTLCAFLFTYLNVMIQAIPQRIPIAPPLHYWGRFFWLLKFEFALDFAFYGIVVISVFLLQQQENLRQKEVRESQLQLALGETRLRAIHAQLNPHFFFNTLQAIGVLAMAGERESVVDVLNRLSKLLRISFDKHRPQQVALACEMEFVDGYLAIHQLCFEQRLTIERRVSAAALNACVPTMLLQPLVENAIVHGIAVKPGNGTLRITADKVADGLLIEVADSGPGFQTLGPCRTGVGLSATESRLKLLFDSHHSIDYGRSDLGGASVRIRIPFLSAGAQTARVAA